MLDISTYKNYIVLGDFNLHHKLWKRFEVSIVYIKRFKELLFIMQRREIEQMIFIRAAIYKKFLGKVQ